MHKLIPLIILSNCYSFHINSRFTPRIATKRVLESLLNCQILVLLYQLHYHLLSCSLTPKMLSAFINSLFCHQPVFSQKYSPSLSVYLVTSVITHSLPSLTITRYLNIMLQCVSSTQITNPPFAPIMPTYSIKR